MRLYILLASLFLQLATLGLAQDIPSSDRPGRWSATDHKNHRDWMSNLARRADEKPQRLHPAVQELQDYIETDPRMFMYFTSMFNEIPKTNRYNKDVLGRPSIRNYHQLLQGLNYLITTAPTYNERKDRMSFVGVPMNDLVTWSTGTPSGYAAFLDPGVNRILQNILNVWGAYLQSPESAYILGNKERDWFGPTALDDLTMVGNNEKTNYTFDEMFHTDPSAPNRGFKSWDDFFTRTFRDGIRPVASPDNDSVIVNSCESQPFKVAHNIKARDTFWMKEQPYSVEDMLDRDPAAKNYVGGTVYQAFLSALSYHRWHAPTSGKIVKSYIINGTYFSVPPFTGLSDVHRNHSYIDNEAINNGESYLTSVATRAVILIEADNPNIGTLAFIGVGMGEVSTCDVTVKEGQHVNKGDQIGMFHYGGSTHCLMFEKGVNVAGFPEKHGTVNFPVREQVAVVHD